MSVWSYGSLQTLFKFAGGAASRAPMMAAVALAESLGESGVVSYAGAIGLWQIMPFWASDFGWPVSYLYQPLYSARAAVHISGGGYHVGAWDTCYNPPAAAARRLDLSWPERGSPAWNILNDHGGAAAGPGSSETVGSPSPGDTRLLQQVAWANHLQSYAIVKNTNWVAWNRTLHNRGVRAIAT